MTAATAAPALASVPVEAAVSVHAALAAVMADMPAIGKDGTAPTKMGGYAFRGIEQITGALQPILARHGVVIVPSSRVVSVVPSPGQQDAWQDTYLEVEWAIYGPDGSSITARTQGVGRDHTDKGATKAASQAFKYLLLQLLCISSKDDADGHDYSQAARPEAPVDPLRADVKQLAEDAPDSVRAEWSKWWEEKGYRWSALSDDDRDAIRLWWKGDGTPPQEFPPNEEPF